VEICRKLQKEHRLSSIYVILITAQDTKEGLSEALLAGASDYITKPFDKKNLLARLKVGQRINELQQQLTQTQKLESIGQLAAGIAHEINTPTQYIGDNISFLYESHADLIELLAKYGQFYRSIKNDFPDNRLVAEIERALQETDLEYLLSEIPKAIKQSQEGIERVTNIVRAMKDFAHPGTSAKAPVDLNRAIAGTITVSRSEWKYVAQLETHFDLELPMAPCFLGEFNQVILNLIKNAADAISESAPADSLETGLITIETKKQDNWAEIRISDNGVGIPDDIKSKIFDPFFTTKEVGQGTGQGLAIAYSIIVDKHGGTITVESEPGRGTTFIIRLPLAPAGAEISMIDPSRRSLGSMK